MERPYRDKKINFLYIIHKKQIKKLYSLNRKSKEFSSFV